MDAQQVIRINFDSSLFVMSTYLSDLTDEQLLKRPDPNANHPAWQLGHIICSSNHAITSIAPQYAPTLPEGFSESYTKEMATENDTKKFHSKALYLELFAKQKEALYAALENFTAEDLDKPGPENMRSYAPTIGAVYIMLGNHIMMHTGQLAVLRRILDKPIVI